MKALDPKVLITHVKCGAVLPERFSIQFKYAAKNAILNGSDTRLLL